MFAPKLPFTGTMAQNQSIFDPIFWLHHSNVERQLCSWQKAFLESDNIDPLSKPSDTLKKRVLYPWTKPSLLWQGNLSHNTESSEENDATFEDWWDHKNLPYEYDEYLPSGAPAPRFGKQAEQHLTSLRIKVYVDASDYTAGDYALFWKEKLLGKVSVLSGTGGVCAHCQSQGDERVVGYKVTGPFDTVGDAEAAVPLLVLKRNGVAIQVKSVAVEKWN
ncbi:hypothetical protein THAOC_27534 [Thalassiosira oceanica]|uniref:Tyrosinase copper-binding domain-containing protein n=1 Tax=Thalassiosira oceanica TaxID=159749 RepID=K0RH99_THAOC|nr:hypothetical protein THAOC_27534 [Thalassiosira oceanica]|eukprot:EJK53093.1 hypothetical protein THAOC_27534 [Thalassiosira oceanica]